MAGKLQWRSIVILIAASLILAFIAFICFALGLEFRSASIGWIGFFSTIAAVFLSVMSIIRIAKTWKLKKRYLITLIILWLMVAFVFLEFHTTYIHRYRARNALAGIGLNAIAVATHLTDSYAEKHRSMPPFYSWFYSLNEFHGSFLAPDAFQLRDVKSVIAYNKILSGKSIDNLPGHVVLFFEADGDENLSGGPELIEQGHRRDRFFVFKKNRFIYVSFVDGTIARYRLNDGAISFFNGDIEFPRIYNFTPYVDKEHTRYSPLTWE